MNSTSNSQEEQFIRASKKALQEGRRLEARNLALRAAELNPDNEECWLILAALASPQASLVYLQNAIRINPASERARIGMKWAMERIQKDAGENPLLETKGEIPPVPRNTEPPFREDLVPQTQPNKNLEEPISTRVFKTVEVLRQGMQALPLEKMSTRENHPSKPTEDRRSTHLSLWLAVPLAAVILVCIGLVGFFLLSFNIADASSASSAQVPTSILFKPTLTPTATITPTPTITSIPTATSTPTPVPTETPKILPTWTYAPVIVYNEPPEGVEDGERWIDVDLSDQMVFAFVGDQIVNSFLVSTGTSAHPTVTGSYHIYVKYFYDDMTGPGYYLPDVPYVMYFYKGYSLHGTYWHHNFGTPMSHGCVNMYTPDAEWLFNWASVGTLVNVHY
jgi:lipoprotein-anchoring transpeptidase ErfK/SrfK